MPRVLIVGPGAIGSIFALLFFRSGSEVSVYHSSSSRLEQINTEGLTLALPDGSEETLNPEIFSAEKDYDLAVFTTKSYQLECALKALLGRLNANYYLFLQNGLKHVEIVSKYIHERGKVFFGVTTLGGYRESHTKTVVASIKGETLVAPFEEGTLLPGILKLPFIKFHPSYKSILWTKALINAAVNPLSAILEVQNGELLRPGNFRIVRKTVDEIVALTRLLSIELTTGDPLGLVTEVLEKTRNNRSSMLQDIENGRRTENDYISGYIVELSRRLRVDMPANEALYNLVKIKEGVTDESSSGSCQ